MNRSLTPIPFCSKTLSAAFLPRRTELRRLGRGPVSHELADDLEPVHARQLNVEQHDVGP
jgi:hypothetical protein